MKIQTLSIISGGAACNAHCPFCISQMTGKNICLTPINKTNFNKACRLAQINDVTNVIITGKGEPILYPEQLTDFLKALKPYNFPILELQTNAIFFDKQPEKYDSYLREWRKLGLTFVAISIVHYDSEKNRQNYIPNEKSYPSLEKQIVRLHSFGYSVRLTCTLVKGGIDSAKEAQEMVLLAKKWGVEQLTLRKVAAPAKSQNATVYTWTKAHELSQKNLDDIEDYLNQQGQKIASFDYGGAIYDVDGQNVCFTNALTLNKNSESFRQAIYFPDGHVRFDWQYQGAIII
jgi:pyruvate-formate lyase-activating enzyme